MRKYLLVLLCFPALAFGTYNNNGPEQRQDQDQTQSQQQDQAQTQDQQQQQQQTVTATGGDGGSASNDGNNTEINSRTENNSSNVVLVPNNNTESCIRVWGIAFGKNGETGALGIPWRSSRCDYEQAADDAFAAGERELGWFWKCQNKSLYKTFRLDGMSKDEAKVQCHQKAVGHITAMHTIDELRSRIDILLEERGHDRERCNKEKDAITKGCYGQK